MYINEGMQWLKIIMLNIDGFISELVFGVIRVIVIRGSCIRVMDEWE